MTTGPIDVNKYYRKPTFTYCGLSIVMSNPSRLDDNNLLSGGGGRLLDDLLRPQHNRLQCEIRLADDIRPWLPGTKCILLLGAGAANKHLLTTTSQLGAVRGSVYMNEYNIPMISSFFPQDCVDPKNYEKEFNAQNLSIIDLDDGDDDSESAYDSKRIHGRTKRRNYRFWLTKDLEKCKHILKLGIPEPLFKANYIIAPPEHYLIKVLSTTKNEKIFIDVETDHGLNIKCISFCFSSPNFTSPVYVFPTFDYNYSIYYPRLPRILAALAEAFQSNEVIAHNGAGFDFILFVWKYKLPLGRKLYDTMIANHRIYSEVEKSLGHCISLWTWEPFHKDEGDVGYGNAKDMEKTMRYCGKDVYTTMLVYYAQQDHIKRHGIGISVNEANDAIRPYLITTIQGIQYDQSKLEAIMTNNDRMMEQYIRICKILLGPDTLKEIAGKSKTSLLGSSQQCVKYFHDMLNYPVVARSPKTNKPSLGKNAMYKLRLQFPDNPIIELVLKYRELSKESGSLKFTPWINI